MMTRLNPRIGALLPALILALAVLTLDQAVKWWMLEIFRIAERPPFVVAPFFKLVMVWNHGVSFGLLSHPESSVPLFLQGVALLICAVLAVLAWRSSQSAERLAYALIIGGALGNVIDRARFGAVADFFYFHIGEYYWPAFNIADSAIFCGVAWLLLMSLRGGKN